ncbi:MAG: hypothetical protein ACLPPF_13280 [Rhodomicrobium sp.]
MRTRLSALLLSGLMGATSAPFLPSHAQDSQSSAQLRPTQLTGLVAERTIIEGKDGIDLTFDKPSAGRLLRFTNDAVGRRVTVFVNHRKLGTLLVRAPIKDGKAQLTGDLDSGAGDALFSPGAVIDLALE